jgi:hypothetical protein
MRWAAGVAAVALVGTACSPNPSGGAGDTTLPPEDAPTSAPFEIPPPTDPNAPTTTSAKVPLSGTLDKGSQGEEVKRLQRRLLELHFDPGGVDGTFGTLTEQAVWAYKKLIMGALAKGVDAKVTPELWDRMQEPLGWKPEKQGDTPRHLEVFLPQQVAVLVTNGVPALITHISTGNGKQWCNFRRPLPDPNADPNTTTTVSPVKYCGVSVTPAGMYRFTLKRKDWYSGYYGDLYNPVFFNGGIAVHGFNSVPNEPASHGCIRIPNHIANYFQTLVRINDQVFVFDGVHDPTMLGPVPAPADIKDPNATTTLAPTTTVAKPTTTAAKATTTAPATTVAPATTPATTVPKPTTTVPAPTTAATAAPTTVKA